MIEEGEGGKGMGWNVEFHHLLLSNLTTESDGYSQSDDEYVVSARQLTDVCRRDDEVESRVREHNDRQHRNDTVTQQTRIHITVTPIAVFQ